MRELAAQRGIRMPGRTLRIAKPKRRHCGGCSIVLPCLKGEVEAKTSRKGAGDLSVVAARDRWVWRSDGSLAFVWQVEGDRPLEWPLTLARGTRHGARRHARCLALSERKRLCAASHNTNSHQLRPGCPIKLHLPSTAASCLFQISVRNLG